jgi:hypothetical protein
VQVREVITETKGDRSRWCTCSTTSSDARLNSRHSCPVRPAKVVAVFMLAGIGRYEQASAHSLVSSDRNGHRYGVLCLDCGHCEWLIVWGFTRNHPYDPSAGDSAGWAFIFLTPVIVPLAAVISLALGLLAYLCGHARVSAVGRPEIERADPKAAP